MSTSTTFFLPFFFFPPCPAFPVLFPLCCGIQLAEKVYSFAELHYLRNEILVPGIPWKVWSDKTLLIKGRASPPQLDPFNGLGHVASGH